MCGWAGEQPASCSLRGQFLASNTSPRSTRSPLSLQLGWGHVKVCPRTVFPLHVSGARMRLSVPVRVTLISLRLCRLLASCKWGTGFLSQCLSGCMSTEDAVDIVVRILTGLPPPCPKPQWAAHGPLCVRFGEAKAVQPLQYSSQVVDGQRGLGRNTGPSLLPAVPTGVCAQLLDAEAARLPHCPQSPIPRICVWARWK